LKGICASGWTITKNHCMMHGQQNVKKKYKRSCNLHRVTSQKSEYLRKQQVLFETGTAVLFVSAISASDVWNLQIIIIIIIIIINIIILAITFMQDIYNYILETTQVSTVYSVAAVLYLQFLLHVMLFRPWNMFCTFTSALPAVCVQCPIWLFFVVT